MLISLLFAGLLFLFYPLNERTKPYSTVLNDRDGNLLSASIADDGQWRFPQADSIPVRLGTCIQYFEDRHFYQHPGVNPLAIGRAMWQNLQKGEVVSGASTLTMQIARMMRGKKRTVWNKLVESFIALKLEIKYSKQELMIKYASMAPFGGNVVGIDAASWRYFNRPSHLLSWGEAASLAVLPNNPGAIFPGRAKDQYLAKRNRLLATLLEHEVIDTLTYELSIIEELPGTPFPIPQSAPHLLTTLQNKTPDELINSTIDGFWQDNSTKILERNLALQRANGVENAALLVIDLETSGVLAYIGNTTNQQATGHRIDLIQRPRSPGSSLKPLLFAHALSKGQILPKTLLPDIPTFFGGFSPKNFSLGYAGAIPADDALVKSLNIPFTYLLRDYTYEQFHLDLKRRGLASLEKPPGHYGLSMILGGGEVTLWELSNAYLSLYQNLAGNDQVEASLFHSGKQRKKHQFPLDPAAIWHTFQAMTNLSRPSGEENWESYSSSQLISWKTGTSYGFRDAWAIGLNGSILVGVWVGNADGEGRAGLTGITAAAPIILETMRLSLHNKNWLSELKPTMKRVSTCRVSGYLASDKCPYKVTMEVPANAELSGICPYHQQVQLDESGKYSVNSSCYSLSQSTSGVRFVLPPTIGHFYKLKNPNYTGLPPMYPGCVISAKNPIEIRYPNQGSKVFIPTDLDGEKGKVILQAAHLNQGAKLYWSIDDVHYGSTSEDHQIEVFLPKGIHQLKVVDTNGNEKGLTFEVLNNPG